MRVTPFLALNAHANDAGNYKMCICVESSTICCAYNGGNFLEKLWIKSKKTMITNAYELHGMINLKYKCLPI